MFEPIQHHLHAIRTRRHDAKLLCATSGQDRTEPAALQWLRRWNPTVTGTELPACTCSAGRCAICN